MTLTERINAVSDNNERWKIFSEEKKRVSNGKPSDFYVAVPVNIYWSWPLKVIYEIGLPNPEGGSRMLLEIAPRSHSSPQSYCIIGEEQALDFVYLLNMARINRKDGML